MFIRYTDLSMNTVQKISALCADLKTLPVLVTHKSNHPDDAYLFLVLAERRRSPNDISYVVWVYNEASNALVHGAYELTLPAALKNMSERLFDIFDH